MSKAKLDDKCKMFTRERTGLGVKFSAFMRLLSLWYELSQEQRSALIVDYKEKVERAKQKKAEEEAIKPEWQEAVLKTFLGQRR